MSGNEMFANDILKRCMKKKYTDIVKGFDQISTHVLEKLFENDLITIEKLQQISDMSKETKGAHVIGLLFNSSNPTAITTFLEILQTEPTTKHLTDAVYEHAREEGHNQGTKLFVSASGTSIADVDGPTKERVRECYPDLIQTMDPYPVLNKLFGKKVITLKQLQEINRLTSIEKCCEHLLQELFEMDESAFVIFKEILHEEQPWLWNTIWTNPVDEENRSLNLHERDKIKANFHCFKKLLKPYENDFIEHLMSNDCITWSQRNAICSSDLTRDEMITKLFETLMRSSFDHFQKFIKCLKITYQNNMSMILGSNGIVLTMRVEFKNSEMEKYLTDIITKTAKMYELNLEPDVKETIESILKQFEEKGIVIVGASTGSLLIYMLCLTIDSVDQLEMMFTAKHLEKDLCTFLHCIVACDNSFELAIKIDGREFRRCRNYFKLELIQKQRAFHCFVGGKLNDLPSILVEMILRRTSWILWKCFLISSLQPNSVESMWSYLQKGVNGFWSFAKAASSQIFHQMSTVCFRWYQLVESNASLRRKLLFRIMKTSIQQSFQILVDNLHVQDIVFDMALEQTYLTTEERMDCDQMSIGDRNKEFLKILEQEQFKYFLRFLHLLENCHQHHLVNHIISFGVWCPVFGKRWPLDKQRKLRIAAYGDDLIRSMEIDKPVHHTKHKLIRVQPTQVSAAKPSVFSEKEELESSNLMTFLFDKLCITVEQMHKYQELKESDRKQKLLKLLETGSFEMYEIVVDYFGRTGQTDVICMLQTDTEVQKYDKYIVNCLDGAIEILKIMTEKMKIPSSFYAKARAHQVGSDWVDRFETNRIILDILQCSKSDEYMFFLNILLKKSQTDILLPMFQSIPHSKLISNFETYLIDSIDANSEFLLKLYNFHVINIAHMRRIRSKNTTNAQNKELLNILSKSSPKSFNLFLKVLVQTGLSNIIDKLQLSNSNPPSQIDEVSGLSENAVEIEVEIIPNRDQIETVLPMDSDPNVLNISSSDRSAESELTPHNLTSEEIDYSMERMHFTSSENLADVLTLSLSDRIVAESKPDLQDEYNDLGMEYSLERKNPNYTWLEEVTSKLISSQTRLPGQIRNILFLKWVAIGKMHSVDVQRSSQHLSSILRYLAETSEGIINREIVSVSYSSMKDLSMIIDPEEIKRKQIEIKNKSIKSRVLNLTEKLTESLDPEGYILEHHVAGGVLTSQQQTEINSLPQRHDRAGKLLAILFNADHPQAFIVFRETLQRDYSWIVQELDTEDHNGNGEYFKRCYRS